MKLMDAIFSVILLVLVFSFGAVFAQAVAVAPPTFLDGVLAWINGLSPTVLATVLGVVAEIGLRLYPSAKALSLLVPVKYVIAGLVGILNFVNGVLDTLISAANKVK